MKLVVLKLIIWPKDTKKSPRILNFKPASINLVTGASKSGKSAVLEIIDYCLASSDCSIPKFGPIRRSSSWYGLLVDTSEGEKLIARKDPDDQNSTDDFYLSEGRNIEIPSLITKNTNRDIIKAMLARLAKLPQVDSDFAETGSGYKGKPSFGDMKAFMFQPQPIVANKYTMFYKTDKEDHARKLREVFPLVLGVVDADTLIMQHRLREIRKILESRRRKLESIKMALRDFAGEVRGRYIVAVELGLIEGDSNSVNDVDIDVLLMRLKDIVSNWYENLLTFQSKDYAISSERFSFLKAKESSLASQLTALKIRLTQLRELTMARSISESNISRERDRLSSISWLTEKLNDPYVCPICGNHPISFNDELENLRAIHRSVESLWDGIQVIPPMLDAEEVQVRKEISSIGEELRQVQFELATLNKETDKKKLVKQQRAIFIGRLEEFLDFQKTIDDGSNLVDEIKELENEEKDLLKLVDFSVLAERKESALFLISKFAQLYGNLMELETGDDLIQLDTSKLSIKVISKNGQSAWMWEIGSGANWLGYHVSTLSALHEFFVNRSLPYVPNLLVLDQPSQTHFPDDEDEESEFEEFDAVRRAFVTFSSAIDRTNGALQVIVSDHAGSRVVENISNANIVERWRKGRKLIPWHWDEQLLLDLKGSKADFALEDLLESIVKPQISDHFGLFDESTTIQLLINSAVFTELGIKFNLKIKGTFEVEVPDSISGLVDHNLNVHIEKG
ncbi:DUF3732 domain-containing protein [Pelotomaculum terephthalicicum JT]|uniref:DUF3732 domain-containing protein n=1 Tax=Pelotomaculum terephthalicicum TaxID=206393 RepID=UPI001F03DB47|nr:DUF3732 domain-containing protein [Pelotomaculum terephthalicicum]MCG9968418.1 DUF3732 domain-containing protein [Pelotomaculum terephthalicicum JT]